MYILRLDSTLNFTDYDAAISLLPPGASLPADYNAVHTRWRRTTVNFEAYAYTYFLIPTPFNPSC